MAAMLTTVDNPFDPRTQFDEWYAYDCARARMNDCPDSCSLLDRLAITSPQLSDELNSQIIEDTIDEIVANDPLHEYKKVSI